jgi:hypothetical protein
MRQLIMPWLAPIAIVTTLATVAGHIAMDHWSGIFATRWSALGALGVCVAGYLLSTIVGLRMLRYFTHDDLRWLQSSLPGPLKLLLPEPLIKLVGVAR